MLRLIKNTSIYTIGDILPQVVSFFLLPVYTRYLTPSDYGIVASMAVLNVILAVLFTFCLERSIYRLFYDYTNEDDRKEYLGTLFMSIVVNSSAITVLMFLFEGTVSKLYTHIGFYPFYAYAILTSFFSVFSLLPTIYFQVTERATSFVALSLGKFLLIVSLTLWYVVRLKAGAAGQLKAGMIANLILLPLYLYISTKVINLKFNRTMLKRSLIYSAPLVPTLLTAWVLNMSGRIFLEHYSNLHDVGIFSLGFTIAVSSLVVMGGFDRAYSPYFFKLANSEQPETAKPMLEGLNNTYALLLLMLVFLVALFSKEVVTFFMDTRYSQTYTIVRILAFAYLFSGLMSVVSLSLLQEKKTTLYLYLSIVFGMCSLVFNYLLVPRFGMYGAAYAIFLTLMIAFCVAYRSSRRCYFIPLNLKRLFGLLCLGILIILVYQCVLESFIYLSLLTKCGILTLSVWWVAMKVLRADSVMQVRLSREFAK